MLEVNDKLRVKFMSKLSKKIWLKEVKKCSFTVFSTYLINCCLVTVSQTKTRDVRNFINSNCTGAVTLEFEQD